MIESMKQALEALKDVGVLTDREWQAVHKNKANELRQAIAELESQEPYGWVSQHTTKGMYEWQFNKRSTGVYKDTAISILPVYTHPQRTWVGLTDEEIDALREKHSEGRGAGWRFNFKGFARAIEAKLKERNT